MKINKIMVMLMILLLMVYPFYYLTWKYPLDRDVWDKLDRAELMAESDDILKLVQEARISLKQKKSLIMRKSQSEGHCALIFKKPSNSLKAQNEILVNIENRLKRTNTFDKYGVEYQTAIDDIRGTLRDLKYIKCWIWHFN